MDERMPAMVRRILSGFATELNHRLPNTVEGLYVHGSIALGAYTPHCSDIDFITVVNRTLTHTDIQILADIHRQVSSEYSEPVMEGSYLRWGDLGNTYAFENMNTYWAKRIVGLATSMQGASRREILDEIEWSVLGMLRQYYTLSENGIVSKLEAGQYGLAHLPTEWHPIIVEAMRIRQGVKVSSYSADEHRVKDTLAFLRYLLADCNR